jgi:hypothetical protein
VSLREDVLGMLGKLHGESLSLIALVANSWVMSARRLECCIGMYARRTKEDILSSRTGDQPMRCYVRLLEEGWHDLEMR